VVTLRVFIQKFPPLNETISTFFQNYNLNPNQETTYMNDVVVAENQSVPAERAQLPVAPQEPKRESASPFALPETEEFRTLLQSTQGVLLQTEHIQIGIIREPANAQVKLSLYYGNLSSSTVSDIDVSVNNPDMNALVFDADAAPENLQPQQQIQQIVTANCVKEFVGAAQFNISYTLEGQLQTFSSHLPVVASSFLSNYQVSSQDFLAAWGQINGDPLENQLMWKTSKGLDIVRARGVFDTLQLSVIDGVEENPSNLVASCLFNTNTQKIPVLCRLESDANSQMFRITTKSFSPILSASISSLIKYFVS